jgi:cation diffusion facilitator CzcD-associated flavoprotein CzcO
MNIKPEIASLVGEIDFDADAIHSKYLGEREMRLREDGIDQYVEVKAEFSRYVDDPYVEPGFSRAPVFDEVQFAIIGGGFGGLLMAARLREAGYDDLRLVETGGDVGGTWYWNRYPGAMCDVESYCYLPLLEELGFMPKHKYSFAPEILEHSRHIARHYRLYDNALFQTSVTELRWSEDDQRWIISTDRGDRFKAQYVAMANGPLNRPKLPGIPGTNDFKGYTFHTSRWDYGYTGGNSYGGLDGLRDKRVGIIGTGATAIQCIPHLGAAARHLYVFQRTPSSIDARNNCETDRQWAAGLAPGWQKRRIENFNILVSGGEQDEDLVGDGWTDIFRNLTMTAVAEASRKLGRPLTSEERDQLLVLADYKKMNQIRARVDSIVKDPATAAALKPWYRQFCKRPCFHDEYLQTYNRSNVTLVDTLGKGVERLTAHGVVANSREFAVDCLIFATGFEVGTSFARRTGYEIIGRGGKTLSEHWADGMRTLHGITVNGFPNCFFIGPGQSVFTVNFPLLLENQTRHVTYIVHEARQRSAQTVELTADAESAYVQEIRRLSGLGERFRMECTPGYYNGEGAAGGRHGFFSEIFGAGSLMFFDMLAKWRDDGRMEGLALR